MLPYLIDIFHKIKKYLPIRNTSCPYISTSICFIKSDRQNDRKIEIISVGGNNKLKNTLTYSNICRIVFKAI